MNKKTLKALNGSIQHWEQIIEGSEDENGIHNCSLCIFFYYRLGNYKFCEGCPVEEKTGKSNCYGSPYWKWFKIFQSDADFDENLPRKWQNLSKKFQKKAILAAEAELKFLKSLLPKD